jgi:hypothetical protein
MKNLQDMQIKERGEIFGPRATQRIFRDGTFGNQKLQLGAFDVTKWRPTWKVYSMDWRVMSRYMFFQTFPGNLVCCNPKPLINSIKVGSIQKNYDSDGVLILYF